MAAAANATNARIGIHLRRGRSFILGFVAKITGRERASLGRMLFNTTISQSPVITRRQAAHEGRGTADRGEYRQAAGAATEALTHAKSKPHARREERSGGGLEALIYEIPLGITPKNP
jgi:hypothetical protein